jgi:predicted lipoprotein with Yx(FWY)xxD motif
MSRGAHSGAGRPPRARLRFRPPRGRVRVVAPLAAGVALVIAGAITIAVAVTGSGGGGRASAGRQVPANEAYVAPPSKQVAELPPGGFNANLARHAAEGRGTPRPSAPRGVTGAGPAGIPPVTVEVRTSPAFGPVLAGPGGMTLYYSTAKSGVFTACSGACTRLWRPLLLAAGQALRSAGNLPGRLAAITRPDGRQQAAYNGSPLYLFAGDHAVGDTGGTAGTWHVIRVR